MGVMKLLKRRDLSRCLISFLIVSMYAALMSIDVREPDLKPYTLTVSLCVLCVLCVPTIKDWYVYSSDFLGYLKKWETGREGFTNAQKATMMLSRETLEGITGKNAMTHAIHYNYILCMLSIPQSIMQYGHSVRSFVIYLVWQGPISFK